MEKINKKILFICQGNVGRSQMAEAFFNHGTKFSTAISGGVDDVAKKYHGQPTARIVQVMKEDGIDISQAKIKRITKKMVNGCDVVVVLCKKELCPSFVTHHPNVLYVQIPDPANMDIKGTRIIRNKIKKLVNQLLSELEKKFIFVAGLHGNEYMPCLALSALGVKYIVGNPKALGKNKRYVDVDLNSSFGVGKKAYETKRASQLLKLIPGNSLVVDFHTFTDKSDPFAIVVDPKLIPLALTTGVKHVVHMKYNIKRGHALINYRHGISVEVGQHTNIASFKTCQRVYKNILAGEKVEAKVYEVYGKIEKKGKYINFKKHKDGFVPILSGENAYDFYGLKAKEIQL